MSYYAGEQFDPEGMVVTATYSDATTAELDINTEITYEPAGELTTEDSEILIAAVEDPSITTTLAITVTR